MGIARAVGCLGRVGGFGIASVVELRSLEINAQACREAPSAGVVGGFVVEGRSVVGRAEAAVEQERIFAPFGVNPLRLETIEDQVADAVLLEEHRCVHAGMAVEAEGTEEPAVGFVVGGAEHEVFGHGVLPAGLCQCKIGERQEILVEVHPVVEVLIAGDARYGEFLSFVADRQSVVEVRAAVIARVVVSDLAGFDIGVRVAALFQLDEREGVVDTKSVQVAVLYLEPAAAASLPVAFFTGIEVLEEAVGLGIVGSDREADPFACFVVGRNPVFLRVAAAVFHAQPHSFEGEGRQGIDVYYAAHRVASEQRALGAAQHFDPLDVRQIEVVGVLVQVGDVVDVESHHRLVDAGAQSPDVDRRGHARAVVRDVEVGNHLRNLFQGCDVPPFQVRASDYGSRYGLVAQVEALFDGRDLDVLHLDNGVRQCRSGVFRQRGGGTYAHGVQEYARRQKDDMDRLADHRIVSNGKNGADRRVRRFSPISPERRVRFYRDCSGTKERYSDRFCNPHL